MKKESVKMRLNRLFSSFELIEHMLENPLYKNVLAARQCRALVSLLGKKKNALIKFTYKRENIIFIAVKSPLALQELRHDSTINQLKFFLKRFNEFDEKSLLNDVTDFKFFIAKNAPKRPAPPPSVKPKIERSDGNFQNRAKNPEFHAFFERLRKQIIANKRD